MLNVISCKLNFLLKVSLHVMIDIIYRILTKLIKTKAHSAWQTLLLGDLEYRLCRINQFNLSTARMHERTFLPFKNKYSGKEIAIIACGPSLNNYKPIPNVINIGVNRAFKDSRINFDHLFFYDPASWTRDEIKELNAYHRDSCVKFYGITYEALHSGEQELKIVSESDALEANALRFRSHRLIWLKGLEYVYPLDISTYPLADFGTVALLAFQFALWTNPKCIYLIGCDCSTNGHFYATGTANELDPLVSAGYKYIKDFASLYYPDTEIVSINPVGLKGLFKDVYQTEES